MKQFLVVVPGKKDFLYVDSPKEAYELAYELCLETKAQEVGLYELKDIGRRTEFAWQSQRKEAVPVKSHHRAPWTELEVRKLHEMVEAGHSHRKIGKALGRTAKAVSIRISRES